MTIYARRVKATPVRTASETWKVIVNILAPASGSEARQELLNATGLASSLIAAETMKSTPIIVYGSGPRIRIYCLYDEDALTGENENEQSLPTNATEGDWAISLPCLPEDLIWLEEEVKKLSSHISVRDMTTTIENEEVETSDEPVKVNMEAFLRS